MSEDFCCSGQRARTPAGQPPGRRRYKNLVKTLNLSIFA
jgi:hypothetical protein